MTPDATTALQFDREAYARAFVEFVQDIESGSWLEIRLGELERLGIPGLAEALETASEPDSAVLLAMISERIELLGPPGVDPDFG